MGRKHRRDRGPHRLPGIRPTPRISWPKGRALEAWARERGVYVFPLRDCWECLSIGDGGFLLRWNLCTGETETVRGERFRLTSIEEALTAAANLRDNIRFSEDERLALQHLDAIAHPEQGAHRDPVRAT